jgi:hypothetical protein
MSAAAAAQAGAEVKMTSQAVRSLQSKGLIEGAKAAAAAWRTTTR